jgi:hypothetical protein
MAKQKLSPGQLKKIWALARELEIDEDILRTRVENVTGQRSISTLSPTWANKVIDSLSGKQAAPSTATNRLTEKQKWKINHMTKEMGWDDPKRLKGFLKKYAGVENINWLTTDQAWRIIEALKKVKEREMTNRISHN